MSSNNLEASGTVGGGSCGTVSPAASPTGSFASLESGPSGNLNANNGEHELGGFSDQNVILTSGDGAGWAAKEAKRKKQKLFMTIILILKCFSLLLCSIVLLLGILGIETSPAYQATVEDQTNCKHGSMSGITQPVRDPSWLSKYKWFEALSILSLTLGLIALLICVGLQGSRQCLTQSWPCDAFIQGVLVLFHIGGGVTLIVGLDEIVEEGTKGWEGCGAFFDKKTYFFDHGLVTDHARPESNVSIPLPSNEDIRKIVNYSLILSAGILSLVTSFFFLGLVPLIIAYHPKKSEEVSYYPEKQQEQIVMMGQQEQKALYEPPMALVPGSSVTYGQPASAVY